MDVLKRDWIGSAQDMDYWRVLMNATLNLRVSLAVELVLRFNMRLVLNGSFPLSNLIDVGTL